MLWLAASSCRCEPAAGLSPFVSLSQFIVTLQGSCSSQQRKYHPSKKAFKQILKTAGRYSDVCHLEPSDHIWYNIAYPAAHHCQQGAYSNVSLIPLRGTSEQMKDSTSLSVPLSISLSLPVVSLRTKNHCLPPLSLVRCHLSVYIVMMRLGPAHDSLH